MAHVTLRPDLRTAGGEVNDILLNGRFAGMVTLVYREGSRMTGSVQLEEGMVSVREKKRVERFIRTYLQQLIDALSIEECDVIVTFGPYDHLVATEQNVSRVTDWTDRPGRGTSGRLEPAAFAEDDIDALDEEAAFDADEDLDDDPAVYGMTVEDDDAWQPADAPDVQTADDPDQRDTLEMVRHRAPTAYFELVLVGHSGNRMEYHVYGRNREWVAEAMLRKRGTDVTGDIHWMREPSDEEMVMVTDLIVSDFDENEVDTFEFEISHDGVLLETIELTHEDLLDDEPARQRERAKPGRRYSAFARRSRHEREYDVVMVRDDGDVLTYDIYAPDRGQVPVGTATMDISRREVSGYIDFHQPQDDEAREQIAVQLMRELDKEREYDSVNFTMMVNSKPVDEIVFETGRVH